MDKLQDNFTTVEQSRLLVEAGLPEDSADCIIAVYNSAKSDAATRTMDAGAMTNNPAKVNPVLYAVDTDGNCKANEPIKVNSAPRTVDTDGNSKTNEPVKDDVATRAMNAGESYEGQEYTAHDSLPSDGTAHAPLPPSTLEGENHADENADENAGEL